MCIDEKRRVTNFLFFLAPYFVLRTSYFGKKFAIILLMGDGRITPEGLTIWEISRGLSKIRFCIYFGDFWFYQKNEVLGGGGLCIRGTGWRFVGRGGDSLSQFWKQCRRDQILLFSYIRHRVGNLFYGD